MSQRNVAVVRSLFEAQARHDLDAIRELYDPSIEWDDVSGLWGDWGSRRGREDISDAFARWFEAFEDVTFQADDFLDAGDHVVVTTRIRGRGRGSGLAVDHTITLVWTVGDGRVTRVGGYRERREALEAIGISE